MKCRKQLDVISETTICNTGGNSLLLTVRRLLDTYPSSTERISIKGRTHIHQLPDMRFLFPAGC